MILRLEIKDKLVLNGKLQVIIFRRKKARTMAGFFYGVVQNDIGLRCAGTLLAAGKAFDTAHHFSH